MNPPGIPNTQSMRNFLISGLRNIESGKNALEFLKHVCVFELEILFLIHPFGFLPTLSVPKYECLDNNV